MTSASDEKWGPFNCFFSRVRLRTCQHSCKPHYICTQGIPAEIQTPAYWNLVGLSMTVLPPVLLPSNILPSSSHCTFIPVRKNSAGFLKNFIIFCFVFTIFKIAYGWKSRDLKLLSRGVQTHPTVTTVRGYDVFKVFIHVFVHSVIKKEMRS